MARINKYKELYIMSLYNFNYFGGWREGNSRLDGHYEVVTDLKEFVIWKFGDYANFVSIRPVHEVIELTASEIRLANDGIYSHILSYGIDDATDIEDSTWDNIYGDKRIESVKMWNELKHYSYAGKYISANIHRGDTIINLHTNESWKVEYYHDLSLINRNHVYKLIDRELHPEPVIKVVFLDAIKNVDPFDLNDSMRGYKVLEALPKLKMKNVIKHWVKVNGVHYDLYLDYTNTTYTHYYIVGNGKVYLKESSISAPFYDAIDKLVGLVHVQYENGNPYHYVVHDVECDEKFQRYRKFEDEKSYEYNTRLTYV
jgi:hypothetical protein